MGEVHQYLDTLIFPVAAAAAFRINDRKTHNSVAVLLFHATTGIFAAAAAA
jgi:hypothetical protein